MKVLCWSHPKIFWIVTSFFTFTCGMLNLHCRSIGKIEIFPVQWVFVKSAQNPHDHAALGHSSWDKYDWQRFGWWSWYWPALTEHGVTCRNWPWEVDLGVFRLDLRETQWYQSCYCIVIIIKVIHEKLFCWRRYNNSHLSLWYRNWWSVHCLLFERILEQWVFTVFFNPKMIYLRGYGTANTV